MIGKGEDLEDDWTIHPAESPRLSSASLLLIGLIIGMVSALSYAWLIAPVEYIQVSPVRLSERYKNEFIFLVSQSYAADGDWPRARARLETLGESNLEEKVTTLLDESVRRGDPAPQLRNLAELANRLGIRTAAVTLFVPRSNEAPVAEITTPETAATVVPSRTASSFLPPTQTSTSAPTPTTLPIYRLLSMEKVCQPDRPDQLLEVEVVDALLEPLPGAEIVVSWENGSDRFFTGFKPELGLGYADFIMNAGVEYSLEMADGSPVVDGITVETCDTGVEGDFAGWRLTFQNTDVQQGSS